MNLTERQISKLRCSARRGARLLDKQRPNWYKNNAIRITELNMGSTCLCVLGQVFHKEVGTFQSSPPTWLASDGYGVGRIKLGIRGLLRRGEAAEQWYGFDAPFIPDGKTSLAYATLGEFWKQEIRKRRYA